MYNVGRQGSKEISLRVGRKHVRTSMIMVPGFSRKVNEIWGASLILE